MSRRSGTSVFRLLRVLAESVKWQMGFFLFGSGSVKKDMVSGDDFEIRKILLRPLNMFVRMSAAHCSTLRPS